GNNAMGNPNVIAIRSAANTDWIVCFPFRNRKPSTIAAQLTAASSSDGGDGFMRHTIAITNRNVSASNTNAPDGSIVRIRTPASTGPAMAATVWNPASSAFEDGSRSGGSNRAGHVDMAGRLNV